MKKFIYKDKITGKKIYSNKEIKDTNLILISAIKDGSIKSSDSLIIKK